MGNSNTKERFRDSIELLQQKDIPKEEAEFWDELWKLKTTTDLVFELISPKDVRKLRDVHPENLHNLIEQAVCQICHVIQTPLPQYYDHALNCVRVLTRTIPFILERPTDPWVKETCWKSVGEAEPLGHLAVHAVMHLLFLPGFTVDVDSFEDAESGENKYASELNHKAINSSESMVFEVRFPRAAWANVNDGSTISSNYDTNRIEVIRLMLGILCEPLYQSAELFSPTLSGHWSQVATQYDAPFASLLFNSLLYTVLGYDPVGYGVPYGSQVSQSVDTSHELLQKSAQLLIVLLDFGANGEPQPFEVLQAAAGNGGSALDKDKATDKSHDNTKGAEESNTNGEDSESTDKSDLKTNESASSSAPKEEELSAKRQNVFVDMLKRFGSDGSGVEFRYAFTGISRLLNNVHEAKNVYLPGSTFEIGCHQEVLVILWKLLEENKDFLLYILKYCDITQLLVPICYIMFEARKDPSKVGLVHICTFILLKLSGERNFSVQLNKPYDIVLPCSDFPLFTGNHADLLVLVLHKLIVNGIDKLSPLYNCFITIIANISPYAKSLCMASSVKLVSLLELFTSHRFLYAAEGNHVYVALLLEVMNNLIQYQYSGNPHIVYAIVRRRSVFEVLKALNLPTALKQAQKQHAAGNAGAPTRSTHVVDTTSTLEDGKAVSQEPGSENKPSSESTGAGRFVPNEKWLAAVKNELPLATILRLLEHVVPQIDELIRRNDGILDDSTILTFLTNTTMVGLLPVPHPIVIRKYTPNLFTGLWFTAFIWGVMFLENQAMPLYDASTIKLFTVSVAN